MAYRHNGLWDNEAQVLAVCACAWPCQLVACGLLHECPWMFPPRACWWVAMLIIEGRATQLLGIGCWGLCAAPTRSVLRYSPARVRAVPHLIPPAAIHPEGSVGATGTPEYRRRASAAPTTSAVTCLCLESDAIATCATVAAASPGQSWSGRDEGLRAQAPGHASTCMRGHVRPSRLP